MTLVGWFLQYFIVFLILALVAVAGFFVGKLLRTRKDKKAVVMAENTKEE